jgi:hypothetical protein
LAIKDNLSLLVVTGWRDEAPFQAWLKLSNKNSFESGIMFQICLHIVTKINLKDCAYS